MQEIEKKPLFDLSRHVTGDWGEIPEEDKKENQFSLDDGPDAGKHLHVCRNEKCPAHAAVTRYQPTPQERATRAKEALAERVEKLTRVRVLDAIRKKLPAALSRPDLEMTALDYFERLGHDNHRHLCRVYGWAEKKTKASWGGSTVDYKTIAGKAVPEMTMHELRHFLVVCALGSDLCCPGYNPRQALGKESNLARTAIRYKIDTERVLATMREELSKPVSGATLRKNKAKKTN